MDKMCAWDSGVWDHGRWSGYDAVWDAAVWDESFWSLVWSGHLEQIITNLEQISVGTYCMEAGCVEPGCDGPDTVLRRILSNLES